MALTREELLAKTKGLQPQGQRSQGNRHGQGSGHGPSPSHNNQPPLTFEEKHIEAPYNFVPLPEKVVFAGSDSVGHDLPLAGHLSGELHYELKAITPLFVGGTGSAQEKNREFFRVHGKYAIPGSSIKGMLRNVVSIAAHAKIKPQGQRYSMRDLKFGPYNDIMKQHKAGWLSYDSERQSYVIQECDSYQIDHKEILGRPQWRSFENELTRAKATTKSKSEAFMKLNNGSLTIAFRPTKNSQGIPAAALENPKLQGLLVFTGQPTANQPPNQKFAKHTEFVFTKPDETKSYKVSQSLFDDVARVHQVSSQRTDDSWDEYSRPKLRDGKRIPVFFALDGNEVAAFGLASMFRLLMAVSPADRVPASHKVTEKRDFAEHLFGYSEKVGAKQVSRKARLFCSPAIAVSEPQVSDETQLMLLTPRPTFYPAYMEQKAHSGHLGALDPSTEYNTFLKKQGGHIRGWKRYPVAGRVSKPRGEMLPTIVKKIKPLAAGATFKGRIVFHNVSPEELGAVIWALTFGGAPNTCHSLGGGKPYGYGSVQLTIKDSTHLFAAHDPQQKPAKTDYAQVFEAYIAAQSGEEFYRTPQIVELLDMASLPQGDTRAVQNFLQYMPKPKDFSDAKGSGQKDRHKRQVLVRYSEARKRLGQSTYRDKPYQPGDRQKM